MHLAALTLLFQQVQNQVAAAVFGAQVLDFVIEYVGQPLEKHQRQDVVFELGRIHRTADGTGGIPKPGFKRLNVEHWYLPAFSPQNVA